MGFSWALSGRVNVKRLADFKKATIDPSRFDDWPDDWGEPGCDAGAMTAQELIDAYADAFAGAVEWKSDGVTLRAVFSNDSDLWLTYRSHFAAAIRSAADFGGTSDVAITGYLDGGPDSVFRVVARADGTSDLEVLTARAAKPIAKKIFEDVQPLVDAVVVAKMRKPVARDPQIEKIHARVCAALRELPPADVLAAVKPEREMFPAPGSGRWKYFRELFDSAPAYIDALERGFEDTRLEKTACVALRLLARASAERGAELAQAYVDDKRGSKALEIVRTEARALLRPVGDPKKAASAIAALKKIAPKSPSVHEVHALASHPDVRRLCESKSREVFAAARDKIDELTAGSKLARLKSEDQMYVLALTRVLEAGAADADWDVLFRIWSESPGFVLMDGARIQSHGERGKKWIAKFFGKSSKNDYARRLQPPAAHALLSLDEKAAQDALAKLLAKKRISEDDDWAAQSMITLLRQHKASPRWVKILQGAAKLHTTTFTASEALSVLVQWKVPKTSKLVLDAIGKSLTLEGACDWLELLGDASVLPALRKHLKALGPKERGSRNRVEQCISALE
jgi:hypothetical protein